MRTTERVTLWFVGSVLAGIVAAHGVHDLRGVARVAEGSLQIELDPTRSPEEGGHCLRLLDELQVRDPRGRRLAGVRASNAIDGGCRLEYPIESGVGVLSLSVWPSPRTAAGNERLILQPVRRGSPSGKPLVLTVSGNVEMLSLAP